MPLLVPKYALSMQDLVSFLPSLMQSEDAYLMQAQNY
jgi:hypothetical protein